jgi:hypothetical protein
VARALVRFNDRAILTDHDGNYRLDQITDSGGSLQITRPGFSMSTDPSDGGARFIQLNQISLPYDIRIYPEALLTGTITSPDGEPVAHVPVTVRRSLFDEAGHRWLPVAGTQTNSHGDFRILVPGGDYRIQTGYLPRIQGLAQAILPITVPALDTNKSAQTIHIRSGEQQHYDLQADTRQTYTVEASIESGLQGFPRLLARSNDGNTFSINPNRVRGSETLRMQLPSGNFTLEATINTANGPQIAETDITVGSHDLSGVVLHFVPTPSIPVELSVAPSATSDNADATPPSPQQLGITLQRIDGGDDPAFAPNLAQLQARRDGPPVFNAEPGTYRLSARNSSPWFIQTATYGQTDLLTQNLVVGAGSGGLSIRLVVSNQTGTVQGTVNLEGTPSPAWIYFVSSIPAAARVISLRSNIDGSFRQTYLPPGTYQVLAFESRATVDLSNPNSVAPYAAKIQSVTITAGNTSNVNLEATPQSEVVP